MRSIKLVLGLGMAACLLAVVAAPALAAGPSWYECAKKTGGNFKDSKCKEPKGEKEVGEFEWVKIAAPQASISEGKLILEDSKTKIGAVKISCEIKSEGTVGTEGLDEITSAELKNCSVVSGTCPELKNVKALNLPWKTELTEPTEKEIRDNIKPGNGTKLPGYSTTCVVIIPITDECTGETSTKMTNIFAEGLVEASFEIKSKKATCTQSKKETGTVEGALKTRDKSGVPISVK